MGPVGVLHKDKDLWQKQWSLQFTGVAIVFLVRAVCGVPTDVSRKCEP